MAATRELRIREAVAPSGSALAGVKMEASPADGVDLVPSVGAVVSEASTETDSAGAAVLNLVPGAEYLVRLRAPGGVSRSYTVTMPDRDVFLSDLVGQAAPDTGGTVVLTDESVLGLAQLVRTEADRGKVLGASPTDENDLVLLDAAAAGADQVARDDAAEARRIAEGKQDPITDGTVLDLAQPARLPTDRGKFLGTAADDENALALLEAPTGGGSGVDQTARDDAAAAQRAADSKLDQSEVDARIAPYARATPTGTIDDAQIPNGIARDTEVTTAVEGEARLRDAADTALGARIDDLPAGREISIRPSGSPAREITLPADYRSYDIVFLNWVDSGVDVEVSLSADLLPETGTRTYRSAGRGRITWTASSRKLVLTGVSGQDGFRTAELYQAGVSNAAGLNQAQVDARAALRYTDAEKSKLAAIAANAEVNVQADWTETDTADDSFIQNKPTLVTLTEYADQAAAEAATVGATVIQWWPTS